MRKNNKINDGLRAFVVPVQILEREDLTIHEKMVYIVLRSFTSAQRPTAWPSYRTIAKLGGMTPRYAMKCVESLTAKGIIVKESRPRISKNGRISCDSNLYTLIDPHDWPREGSEQDSLGVVNEVHQGSEQDSLGVVNEVHQGSEQDSPEYHHQEQLKVEHPHMNSNIKAPVDDDLLEIAKKIRVSKKTLARWGKLAKGDKEKVISAIEEALSRKVKNPGGYVTTLLQDPEWVPTEKRTEKGTELGKVEQRPIQETRDDIPSLSWSGMGRAVAGRNGKYAAFYALIDGARGVAAAQDGEVSIVGTK